MNLVADLRAQLAAKDAEVARLMAEVARLRDEIGRLLADSAVLRQQGAEANARIGELAQQVAKANDRIGELLAIAQRKKRGVTPPAPEPPPPPALPEDQQQAFADRPKVTDQRRPEAHRRRRSYLTRSDLGGRRGSGQPVAFSGCKALYAAGVNSGADSP